MRGKEKSKKRRPPIRRILDLKFGKLGTRRHQVLLIDQIPISQLRRICQVQSLQRGEVQSLQMLQLMYGLHAIIHLKAPIVRVMRPRGSRHIRDEEAVRDGVRLLGIEDLPVGGKLQACDAEFPTPIVNLL